MNRMIAAAIAVLLLAPAAVRAQAGTAGEGKSLQYWQSLPAERREVILKNYERFRAMTPAQKALMAERFLQFQGLPPKKKLELLRRWEWFKSLSPEKQKELGQRFASQRGANIKTKVSGAALRERRPSRKSDRLATHGPRRAHRRDIMLRLERGGPKPHPGPGPRR
jgi:hypothetical protein